MLYNYKLCTIIFDWASSLIKLSVTNSQSATGLGRQHLKIYSCFRTNFPSSNNTQHSTSWLSSTYSYSIDWTSLYMKFARIVCSLTLHVYSCFVSVVTSLSNLQLLICHILHQFVFQIFSLSYRTAYSCREMIECNWGMSVNLTSVLPNLSLCGYKLRMEWLWHMTPTSIVSTYIFCIYL